MSSPKHLVIIGAGPGGDVAAFRAPQLGAKVTDSVLGAHLVGAHAADLVHEAAEDVHGMAIHQAPPR